LSSTLHVGIFINFPHKSDCLSQVGALLKRPNVGSRKQRHTIALGLSAKLKLGHPNGGTGFSNSCTLEVDSLNLYNKFEAPNAGGVG